MALDEYKSKRYFDHTPEPEGEFKKHKEFHFVVQKHDASHLHYDFRLEANGVLKSWAVPKGPPLSPRDKRLAVMTEDHPHDYLTFEGTIPEGNYGAGTVMVWDIGTYRVYGEGDPNQIIEDGLKKGHVTVILDGVKLKGEFALVRTGKDGKNWLMFKKNDEFSNLSPDELSVLTERNLDEITHGVKTLDFSKAKKTKFPHGIKPMTATLVDDPFNDSGWLFEIKWDGYRAIAEVQTKGVNFYSRNFLDFRYRFEPIYNALEKIDEEMILDGEVVVLKEDGTPSFQLLQNYERTKKGKLVYYVFDILYYRGYDLTGLSLIERKRFLREAIRGIKDIIYSEEIEENGIDFFNLVKKKGLEGIIAKSKQSLYLPGFRTKQWLKIKSQKQQEGIICGYTEPRGSRKYLGALILGAYDNKGELEYIGHSGSAMPDKKLKDLKDILDKLKQPSSPFKNPPKTNMPVTWLKPKIVCEVKFTEWTDELIMRQPFFLRLREDKNPKEVKIELPKDEHEIVKELEKSEERRIKINNQELKLTNLKKVFWPEEPYTKGDLINYYLSIADTIMPHLIDRPQSLHRYPDGIYGEDFYQKNMPPSLPKWIKTIKIRHEHENREVRYFLCQSKEDLIYLINFGCIDLNPWSSRLQKLDFPDFMVIDLDPEDISFDYVVETAQAVKTFLDKIDIPSYPKTSGATGMHIYIPTEGKYNYDQVKDFAKIIATLVQKELPKTTSIVRSPAKRQKKVYLDFLQNIRGQTLASPYSVRPVPGATVSTPLEWKEVKTGISPKDFTMRNIPDRLKELGDLFKPVLGDGIDLIKALKKIENLT